MGFSKKNPSEGGKDSDGKKWIIAGIAVRGPLKSISTKPKTEYGCEEGEEARSAPPTTPTAQESRIPERLPCPPAPRKPRPVQTCHFDGAFEFFNPSAMEIASVFVERPIN